MDYVIKCFRYNANGQLLIEINTTFGDVLDEIDVYFQSTISASENINAYD